MPGVVVQTGTIPGPEQIDQAPGAAYFVPGLTERGDATQPVLIRSMSEYVQLLGNRVTYGSLFDDLSVFFGEGGVKAYVMRVVGPAAAAGSTTLKDSSVSPGINTLQINAKNPGSWSANISVQIVASALANQYKVLVFYSGVQVEVWGPFPDIVTCVSVINAQSGYIAAVNLASTSPAPSNNPVAISNPVSLTSGTDDRAHVTGSTYIAALANFGQNLGSGMVAVPGQDSSIVGTGLIAHAAGNSRLAILSPVQGSSETSVIASAATFRGTPGSEFAGFFFPWVQIPDGAGGVRTIPPDGFVAGCHSSTQVTDGPYQSPAGKFGTAQYIVGLEMNLSDADGNTLDSEHVNVIRPIAGIRLYGWRSLSTDTVNYDLLNGRDTMNYVATVGKAALEQYVFGKVDAGGQFFGQIAATMRSILEPLRTRGGLYQQIGPDGLTLVDPGYLIDTGPSVNTLAVLGRNEVDVNVYIRVSPNAELLKLTVTKVAFGNPI